jgi:two-component system response regulator
MENRQPVRRLLKGEYMENRAVRVLLIENDAADQVLVKNAIEKCGYNIDLKIVPNAEYAFKYLQKSLHNSVRFPRPGLILLDLNMLGLGGKGFLKEIKASEDFNSIPVVVLSSSDQQNDVDECYRLHAAGYIHKMGTLQEYNSVFEKIVRYWYPVSSVI